MVTFCFLLFLCFQYYLYQWADFQVFKFFYLFLVSFDTGFLWVALSGCPGPHSVDQTVSPSHDSLVVLVQLSFSEFRPLRVCFLAGVRQRSQPSLCICPSYSLMIAYCTLVILPEAILKYLTLCNASW